MLDSVSRAYGSAPFEHSGGRDEISLDEERARILADLPGASQGVFAADDTHLRRSFTTTVSLGNQLAQAAERAFELELPGWN